MKSFVDNLVDIYGINTTIYELISEKEQFPQTEKELLKRLKQFKIDKDNCTILDDFSVNVKGNVNLSNKNLMYLPIKFNKVSGNFNCSDNKLVTLRGSPDNMNKEKSFNCSYNQLKSLQWAPSWVGNEFNCSQNNLTSLEYCPKVCIGTFNASFNHLTEVDDMPNSIIVNLSHNQITHFSNKVMKKDHYVIQYLYLSHNKLQNLSSITCCDFLKELDCSYNEINSTKNIKNMNRLQTLNLSYNHITSFKNNFAPSIFSLSLNNNKISKIHTELMTFLDCLNLLDNPIKNYKPLFQLKKQEIEISLDYKNMNLDDKIKFCKKFTGCLYLISGDEWFRRNIKTLWVKKQGEIIDSLTKQKIIMEQL